VVSFELENEVGEGFDPEITGSGLAERSRIAMTCPHGLVWLHNTRVRPRLVRRHRTCDQRGGSARWCEHQALHSWPAECHLRL
jgi:hypothetical protein